MKVVVLAGGLCPERNVSLSSGSLIANALIENGHSVTLLDLYRGVDVNVNSNANANSNENANENANSSVNANSCGAAHGALDKLFIDASVDERFSYTVSENEPNLEQLKSEAKAGDESGNKLIGKNVINICQYADLVFNALHGDIGENGKLQAIFDSFGIRYTGTGYTGCLLAMDKDLSKQIMRFNGILTADWASIRVRNDNCASKNDSCASKNDSSASKGDSCASKNDSSALKDENYAIIDNKSASKNDSSALKDENYAIIDNKSASKDDSGVSKDENYALIDNNSASKEYNNALSEANRIGFPCVVKPLSCGSSVGVSIVNNAEELSEAIIVASFYESDIIIEKYISGRELSVGILDNEALPPIEIIPSEGFYNYKNKYQIGMAKEICPAQLPNDIQTKLRETALEVHRALRLGAYSRIDFILDEEGNAFCLEANTLPGMTATSLLPQEAAAAGISYNELCEIIIELSSKYHK